MKYTNRKKKELVTQVARDLYRFNIENKKYSVSENFSVDGVEYNIREEVFKWLKKEGYTNLLKLMEFTK